jgi:hypothetical protein
MEANGISIHHNLTGSKRVAPKSGKENDKGMNSENSNQQNGSRKRDKERVHREKQEQDQTAGNDRGPNSEKREERVQRERKRRNWNRQQQQKNEHNVGQGRREGGRPTLCTLGRGGSGTHEKERVAGFHTICRARRIATVANPT